MALRTYWLHRAMREADGRASRAASEAEAAARRAGDTTERLRSQIEQQALVIRSLVEMCARKGLFSEEELRDVIREIDLSDGRLDGRYRPETGPVLCPQCAKPNARKLTSCMYCGAELTNRDIL
jgi:hypothetical protein